MSLCCFAVVMKKVGLADHVAALLLLTRVFALSAITVGWRLIICLRKYLGKLRLSKPLAEVGVEAVLDCVVGAAFDLLGDVAPAVPVH